MHFHLKQLLELLSRSRIVLGANDTPFPFNTAKKPGSVCYIWRRMHEIVHSRFALFTIGTDDIKKDYVFFKSYVGSKRLNLWLDKFFMLLLYIETTQYSGTINENSSMTRDCKPIYLNSSY